MTDLNKLIEDMEKAGEGRTPGPWKTEYELGCAHRETPAVRVTVHERGPYSYLLASFNRHLPGSEADSRLVATCGTYYEEILEGLRELARLKEALTASGATKYDYMGEVRNDNGTFVGWTQIKDIMKMISARPARSSLKGGE